MIALEDGTPYFGPLELHCDDCGIESMSQIVRAGPTTFYKRIMTVPLRRICGNCGSEKVKLKLNSVTIKCEVKI